ncbi:MAG: signal peptidase I [SAR202 cluster bacterium]|nr:signal peptidase I [SAR202 cluster bacterium]
MLSPFLWFLSTYRVEGDSMAPAFHHGQRVSINRRAYKNSPPQRGHVVLFRHPTLPHKPLLKRIVGLPTETIHLTKGRVHINDTLLDEPYVATGNGLNPTLDLQWSLSDDEYLVLGDNRRDSLDSRRIGPVKLLWLTGKV